MSILRSQTFRWILAIVITLASAVYQRMTGPSYPFRGNVQIEETDIKYRLTRTHGGAGNQPIEIIIPDKGVSAQLVYRRFPTSEEWTKVSMQRNDDKLIGEIPHQPPAGKVEYHIILEKEGQTFRIPEGQQAVTRFKDDVPATVLAPHILFMFLGMLLSTRVGIEALDKNSNPRKMALLTFGLLTLGGMILGPIVQKYAFGAFWTGIPFGWDLTDNKTLISFVAWIGAIWAGRKGNNAHGWILAASIITLIIFMIPHSVLGSELNYE